MSFCWIGTISLENLTIFIVDAEEIPMTIIETFSSKEKVFEKKV